MIKLTLAEGGNVEIDPTQINSLITFEGYTVVNLTGGSKFKVKENIFTIMQTIVTEKFSGGDK